MKYSVSRVKTISESAVVEAESEDEAIEQATYLDEEAWKKDPNDSFHDEWYYNADLI